MDQLLFYAVNLTTRKKYIINLLIILAFFTNFIKQPVNSSWIRQRLLTGAISLVLLFSVILLYNGLQLVQLWLP